MLDPEESVGGVELVTTFTEDSVSVVVVLANKSALTTFFPLANFSVLRMIFILANFPALVALGHLLATWSLNPQ